jgi:PIN domain nuclease of toxin-antitoxin system
LSAGNERIVNLTPCLLLDTHVAVRWLAESSRLSKDQLRALRAAVGRSEPLALSAISLLEIAVLSDARGKRMRFSVQEILTTIDHNDGFHIVPIDIDIATEVAALGDALRDPADRAIVATARVHRLRLVTSDQRIIESKLAPVLD